MAGANGNPCPLCQEHVNQPAPVIVTGADGPQCQVCGLPTPDSPLTGLPDPGIEHTYNKDTPYGYPGLDANARINVARLPTDAVTGQATGGAEPWAPSTHFPVNLLVSNAGTVYICTTDHTSGASFDPTKFQALTAAVPSVSGQTAHSTLEIDHTATVKWVREHPYQLFPGDYGATSVPGTINDDTTAFKNLIADAFSLYVEQDRWCEVMLADSTIYGLGTAGTLDTTQGGNAILALPMYATPGDPPPPGNHGGGIVFRGGSAGRIIPGISGQGSGFKYLGPNTLAYSTAHGPPSLIGGPTRESVGDYVFMWYELQMDRVSIIDPNPNPSLCGIDATAILNADLDIGYFGNDSIAPAHVYQFAVRMPGPSCGTYSHLDGVISGAYWGFVAGPHLTIGRLDVGSAVWIMGIPPGFGFDPHAVVITRLESGGCVHGFAGYSPNSGAISQVADNGVNGGFHLRCLEWNFEDSTDVGGWYDHVSPHILDANNVIYGTIHFTRIIENTGWAGPTANLDITGGANIAEVQI